MKKNVLFMVPLALSLAAGCTVDEKYSLENIESLDTEVTLFSESLGIPVGSVSKINLGSFLNIEDTGSILRVSESGDYSLVLEGGDPTLIDVDLDVPYLDSFEMSKIGIIDYDFSEDYTPYIGTHFTSLSVTQDVEGTSDLTIAFSLPSEVQDIRNIALDVPVTVKFALSSGKLVLKSGYTLTFPNTVTLESLSSDFKIVGGNTVVAARDVILADGYTAKIRVTGLAVPPGSISSSGTSSKVELVESIKFKGDLQIDGSNFTELPSRVRLEASFIVDAPKVLGADVKLNASRSLDTDLSVEVGDIPEFFRNSSFILEDPVIKVDVTNRSPFNIALNATVHPCVGPVKSGSPLVLDNVPVKSDTESRIWICNSTHDCPSGVTAVRTDAICDILKIIPDSFGVSDVAVSITDKDFIHIDGGHYSFSMQYVIEIPLSFRTGSHILFSYDFEDVGLSDLGDVELEDIELTMDIENSIPFDMKETSSGFVIKAGTQAAPTTSHVVYSIKPEGSVIDFNTLSLSFSASVPESLSGVVLNSNQGIAISNIVISAKGGVTIKNEDK